MCRVLVVDDHRDAAESLALLLSAKGCETRIAFDGREAVWVDSQFEPDVIISDLEMPIMDGYDAARQIRASHQGRGPFMLALSAMWGSNVEQWTRAAGFDAFIRKPASFESIFDVVKPFA